MAIADVAAAVKGLFPASSQATMVAIGMAESGCSETAAGDPLSNYRPLTASDVAHSCGGDTSFGWSQVNLPSHAALIADLSGVPASNPCGQAAWLKNYQNAARAAYRISNGGTDFRPWSTYWRNVNTQAGPGQGAYRTYLAQAKAALAGAPSAGAPSGGPVTAANWLPVLLVAVPLAALALADLRRL